MGLRLLKLAAPLLFLAACNVAPLPDGSPRDSDDTAAAARQALPPMKRFGATQVRRPTRGNVALAQDFLELSFEMESGRMLPRMTRFEGPVTVAVRGAAPATLGQDLRALIARLRSEAGIDIRLARPNEPASITVNVITQRELRRLQPDAACFILPNISTWEEFRRMRRSPLLDWSQLTERTQAAIFLPGDVAPQEIRDCLHEEIAQALGPLNDVYRLGDSIFNDDNFNRILTGFDMLMLRAYYDGALRNGMTKGEVAARLPAILNRLNPGGRGRGGGNASPTPRSWVDAVKRATGPGVGDSQRRNAAARAVAIARQAQWQGPRAGFSLYIQGRLNLLRAPDLALASLLEARAIYASSPDTALHAASVATQLAAFALSAGQADSAIKLVDDAIPTIKRAQNAGALATLLMIKAEALDLAGRPAEAAAVRLESLGWGRYGFGDDATVRARLREIRTLSPRPRGA